MTEATYFAAYRGGVLSGASSGVDNIAYGIGLAESNDLMNWTKLGQITELGAQSWEADLVTDPCLVKDADDKLYLYYAGKDTTAADFYYRIGVATSVDGGDTWNVHDSNPIISLGGAGTWDESYVRYPHVVYDPDDADPTRRFKMWYCGRTVVAPANGGYTIGYAYSADGLSWTKYAGNPVLEPGPEFFDAFGCLSPVVMKISGLWWLWYCGLQSDYGGDVTGLHNGAQAVTSFSNPESSYVKDAFNPNSIMDDVFNSYSSSLHDVTATVLANATTLHVADSSDFDTDDEFYLRRTGFNDPDPNHFFLFRVIDVPNGTTIEFTPPMPETVTIDAGNGHIAFLRRLWMGTWEPRTIRIVDGLLTMFGSAVGAYYWRPDNAGPYEVQYPIGRATVLVGFDPAFPNFEFDPDHTRGVLLPLGDAVDVWNHDTGGTAWDRDQADQMSIIDPPPPIEAPGTDTRRRSSVRCLPIPTP